MLLTLESDNGSLSVFASPTEGASGFEAVGMFRNGHIPLRPDAAPDRKFTVVPRSRTRSVRGLGVRSRENVRRIGRGVCPNQSPDPTLASVTPPAEQEARLR